MTPVALFKCLADDTRLRLVRLMLLRQELCVCELVAALALSQPRISRHLAMLRRQGLLSGRRQGQWVYYRLNPQLPGWARQVLQALQESREDCLPLELQRLETLQEKSPCSPTD